VKGGKQAGQDGLGKGWHAQPLAGQGAPPSLLHSPTSLPSRLDAFTISNALVQRAHLSPQHQSQFAAFPPALDCVPALGFASPRLIRATVRAPRFISPTLRSAHHRTAPCINFIHSNSTAQPWYLDAPCPSGRIRCWSPSSLQRVSAHAHLILYIVRLTASRRGHPSRATSPGPDEPHREARHRWRHERDQDRQLGHF
jgi:hypothetical protein